MLKNLIMILLFVIFISLSFYSKAVDFEIIPESKTGNNNINDIINKIGTSPNGVNKEYSKKAKDLENKKDLGTARATGVFNWNLILLYFKYLIKFLSQVGMVIGALMIIYAGYLYASAVFSGSNPQKGATAVKNAILGVFIIIFSYAILKILTLMFL